LLDKEHYSYLSAVNSQELFSNPLSYQQINSWREILTGDLAKHRLKTIVENKYPNQLISAELCLSSVADHQIAELIEPITELIINSKNNQPLTEDDLGNGYLSQRLYNIYQTAFLNSSLAPQDWQSIYFALLTKSNKQINSS
jgi:hypothetical protein